MESSQTQPHRTTGQAHDPIEMLKHDHREVEQMFKKFKQASGSQKEKILKDLKSELDPHMKIEEEIFYPAAEKVIKDKKLVKDGIAEHREATKHLKQAMEVKTQEAMDRHEMELEKVIQHHVQEEEGKMFPQAREAMKHEELMQLGSQMQTRKQELKKKN